MSINDAKWTVAPAVLASSITSFSLLTFGSTPKFSPNFPFPCPRLLLLHDNLFQNTSKSCFYFIGCTTPTILLHKICRALQEPQMFPISYEHSWWFLWIPCPPGQWNRSLAIFVRSPDGAFHWTTFASPPAWHSFPLFYRFLAINYLAWMSSIFSFIWPRPQISFWRFFFQ